MRIELNGRKIVDTDYFIDCTNCLLYTDEPKCLAYLFGIRKSYCTTGFKYEDNI